MEELREGSDPEPTDETGTSAAADAGGSSARTVAEKGPTRSAATEKAVSKKEAAPKATQKKTAAKKTAAKKTTAKKTAAKKTATASGKEAADSSTAPTKSAEKGEDPLAAYRSPTATTTKTTKAPKTTRATETPETPSTSKADPPAGRGGQLGGLLRAAHPRLALAVGLAVAVVAYADGRSWRASLLAGAAVLVVQVILGLLNDAGDEARDRRSGISGKPVADGRLPAGNARFAATCLVILAVPLALESGGVAALSLLAYLVLGLLSRTPLRRTWLSWVPWALSFATLPAFVSYSGDAGLLAATHGPPPTWPVCVAAAAIGVGVHVLLALPHLVADNKNRLRHLPLRVALRTGAGPLLALTVVWLAAAVVGLVLAWQRVGFHQ